LAGPLSSPSHLAARTTFSILADAALRSLTRSRDGAHSSERRVAGDITNRSWFAIAVAERLLPIVQTPTLRGLARGPPRL